LLPGKPVELVKVPKARERRAITDRRWKSTTRRLHERRDAKARALDGKRRVLSLPKRLLRSGSGAFAR
jgi:hypothetical protein